MCGAQTQKKIRMWWIWFLSIGFTVWSTCVYIPSTAIVGSEITRETAELACSENRNCLESFPLVSFSENDEIGNLIGCEDLTNGVLNCTYRYVIADSLHDMISYYTYHDIIDSLWTNTNELGNYQECTMSTSRRLGNNNANDNECGSAHKIMCVCSRYINELYSLWAYTKNGHFKLVNGTYDHCSISSNVLLFNSSELLVYAYIGQNITTIFSNGTRKTGNIAINGFTLVHDSELSVKITTYYNITGGVLLNGCVDVRNETLTVTPYCDALSNPFNTICRQDMLTLGTNERDQYRALENFMDFLGVSYPDLPVTQQPSITPSTTPTLAIPTFSPTKSRPSMSPTLSPSRSKPTHSPSKAPIIPPTFSPSITPTSSRPSLNPTFRPTRSPTPPTTMTPTLSPITVAPTSSPSKSPTRLPTGSPTRLETASLTSSSECYSNFNFTNSGLVGLCNPGCVSSPGSVIVGIPFNSIYYSCKISLLFTAYSSSDCSGSQVGQWDGDIGTCYTKANNDKVFVRCLHVSGDVPVSTCSPTS